MTKIFSVVAPYSLADTHRHFRVPAASIVRVMEATGSSQTMLHIYWFFLEYCPWGEKKFAPFSYVCVSGGSLHCFWCT